VGGDRLGYVAHYELARNYGRAVAGLNVSRQHDALGINSKTFEIAGSGAVLLQRYRKGVEQLYDDGRDCFFFREPQEAAQRLQQLLDDPDLRQEMAASGVAKTMAQHRWMSRMNRLLDSLEHHVIEVIQNAPIPFDMRPGVAAPGQTPAAATPQQTAARAEQPEEEKS
jgi:spore maturation protein CgeB